MLTMDPDGLVVIMRFADVATAMMARATLEAAGIEAFLPEEHLASLNWQYSLALGGIGVQVHQARAEEALSILNSLTAGTELPTDVCPRCGSAELKLLNRTTSSAALVLLLPMSLPAVLSLPPNQLKSALMPWRSPHVYRCQRCGLRWRLPFDAKALEAIEPEVANKADADVSPDEATNEWWWWTYAVMTVATLWMLHRYVTG